MTNVRKSLFLSMFEKYASLLVNFGVSIVMARLLTPEDFGVFTVAYSVVGVAHIIREMGINSYIIQREELRSTDVRACLFLTFTIAWILSLIIFLLLPFIGRLYGETVENAIYIMLINFVIMPFSSTIFAVLQREMRFDLLLRINLAGALVNSGCAILLAIAGWGYMSLAWACVAGQLANVVVAGLYRPHAQHFLPSHKGVLEVVRFGSVVMAGTLLQQVSTNVASLITARYVTLEAMGLFSRSQSVTGLFGRLILDGIQPLMLPLFSRLKRGDADVGPVFERTFSCLAILTWPFFCFLSLCSEPIILLMFGQQWKEAAYLLQLISVGGLFWIVQPVANPLLIALGRVGAIFRIQLINQSIALVGVLVASMHGIEAVAMAAIPISAAHGCLWLYSATRIVHVRTSGLIRAVYVSAAVTGMAMILPVIVIVFGEDLAQFEKLVLAGVGAGFGWMAGVFICRHPISAEIVGLALQLGKAAARRADA